MKLDRNINPDGRGKYALLRLRNTELSLPEIRDQVSAVVGPGVLQFGDNSDSEFFVIKLKDQFAAAALFAYAEAAHGDDPEYSLEIYRMAEKSERMKTVKPT